MKSRKLLPWLLASFALKLALPMSAHAFGDARARPELTTVPHVNLERYLGRWYEIASIPQSFQKGCTATRATYSAREDGSIDVLNECNLETVDGRLKQAHGRAKVVDRESNSKLKVTFFWPFYGDYWIVDLGPDYEYAAVGAPNREYLWILSRGTTLDESTYSQILSKMSDKGFDVSRLVKQIQP